MKNQMMIAILVATMACAWVAVPSATAAPIDLGIWDPAVGAVCPGESAGCQLQYLNTNVIPAYNAVNDPDLSLATFGTDNISASGLSITLDVTGYDYLKLKWDGMYQFYYLDGTTGDVFFESTVFNDQGQPQALSHYTFFSPSETFQTPEPATLLLLGMGLLGVGIASRKKK